MGGVLSEAEPVLWYSFNVREAQVIELKTGQVGSTDTKIGLYDQAGNLLAVNEDTPFNKNSDYTSLILRECDQGNYFLAVAGYDAAFGEGFAVSGGNIYAPAFTVSVRAIVPATVPALAGALEVGAPGLVGALSVAEPVLWYSLDLPAGAPVMLKVLTTNPTNATSGQSIGLFDRWTGTSIASADGAEMVASGLVWGDGGEYIVGVAGQGASFDGAFSVQSEVAGTFEFIVSADVSADAG